MKKKSTKTKTTQRHFEVFKKECEYWFKYFGLFNYELSILHRRFDSGFAQCDVSDIRSNAVAVITLNTEISIGERSVTDCMTNKRLRQSAFHEIIELMLWKIGDIITLNEGGSYERRLTHELIRILENTVFVESYQRRFGGKKKL